MKTLHTPGPWQLLPKEDDKDYYRIRGTKLGTRYKIANVCRPSFLAFNDKVNELEESESIANAALIADAPELLQSLASLVDCISETRGKNAFDALQKASELIAKHTTK